MNNDLKKVFLNVWCIISLIILGAVLAPFIFSAETILFIVPACPSAALYNEPCAACGLTRSFISISNFNFSEALIYNKASVYIYFTFLLNEILLTAALIIILSKHKKSKLCQQQV